MATAKYYGPRQIIKLDLVEPGEYTENVIICIPKFAWRVARAYLSRQAGWKSSYAVEFGVGSYTLPSDEQMDIVLSSIAEALSRDDMSCDLEQAIDNLSGNLVSALSTNNDAIVSALADLVAKNCCASGGSRGTGWDEAEPIDYTDDGTNYPDDFDGRTEFVAWKCNVAGLIIDQFLFDLRWFQQTDILEITAEILVVALLTPIPGSRIAGLLAAVALLVSEGLLDTILEVIISELEDDRDNLVCMLYNAINNADAISELEAWADAKLTGFQSTIFGFFISDDVINWLFTKVNLILGEEDCSGCAEPAYSDWTVITGTLDSGSLSGDSEGFALESVYSTSGACNRYQVYFTAPPEANFGISMTQLGGVTPMCCGGAPCVNAWFEDNDLGYIEFTGTDEMLPYSGCLAAGGTVLIRYTQPFVVAVTISGVC